MRKTGLFPPSDLKISKSAILDFRFIDYNQEILRMFLTIARSSSAPKLLKPKKKKIIDPTFPYKTGLKITLTPFCTFFLVSFKVLFLSVKHGRCDAPPCPRRPRKTPQSKRAQNKKILCGNRFKISNNDSQLFKY